MDVINIKTEQLLAAFSTDSEGNVTGGTLNDKGAGGAALGGESGSLWDDED